MTAIQDTFGRQRVLLPVIHFSGLSNAMKSVETAVEAGAGGVMLINQGCTSEDSMMFARFVAISFPELWIGMNLLGATPAYSMTRFMDAGLKLGGLWSDASDDMVGAKVMTGWRGLTFGGLAFKHQPRVAPGMLAVETARCSELSDVPTTSGDRTGIPASVDKVKAIHAAMGGHSLGLASGVTPENVRQYLPYCDAFLVATGIERSYGMLDRDRTRRLADLIAAGPTS